MEQINKTKTVIVGGGTAGWVTAYSLAKRLGKLLDITLVESSQIGTIGVGEATIPSIRVFHELVEIDEAEVVRTTQATFKFGISLENWGNIGDKYIHSFGDIGQSNWMAKFHEYWLEAREQGFGGDLADYCLELKAATQNKFSNQIKVHNRNLIYAYQLDATAYAAYLRKKAEALGVKRIEGDITGASLHPESGDLTQLHLENGEDLDGDFFIDCTGFQSLLLGQYMKIGFEDWSHWLGSNRAIAIQTEPTEPAVPYTRCIAYPKGWRWQIPLQNRVGNGFIYSSKYLSDDEAQNILVNDLPGRAITEPLMLQYTTGHRKKCWHKNCVAIGLSGGFLEPLESTGIHMITTSVIRLMRLFPFSGNRQKLADEYNRLAGIEFESLRDFIILHYKLTNRNDSDYWNDYRTMDIPDSLAHRMEMFKHNGYASSDDAGLFHVTSWVQVMLGQGLYPEQHHHAGKLLSPDGLKELLGKLSMAVDSSLRHMPTHEEFIKDYRSDL